MPEVNLLRDTKNLPSAAPKKVAPPTAPELSNPDPDQGPGLGEKLKSLFSRRPRTLPVAEPPKPVVQGQASPVKKGMTGERILSEVRHTAPSMIPLPEEDDDKYNVNLLSEELTTTVDPKRRVKLLGLVTLGSFVLVGLVYSGLLIYQQSIKRQTTSIEDQLTAVRQEISRLSTEQQVANTTVQKIGAIRTLIERHTRWTKFFRQLEKYTLPSVTYGPSFSADVNGNITLSATTTSYEEVARQYLILQQLVKSKSFISNFSITGASTRTQQDGPTIVSFSMSLTLLPTNFTMSAEEFDRLITSSSSSGLQP